MKRYSDIRIQRDKDRFEIEELLRRNVSIWNAHYQITMEDGREYPYVLELMNKGCRRFYQVGSKREFQMIVNSFEVKNKIIE